MENVPEDGLRAVAGGGFGVEAARNAPRAGARLVWRLTEQTHALAAFAIRLWTTKYSASNQVFCVTGFLG
ncbi:unnamed protein product [Arctia plantaginis]|uniref:Uncharacterized protein n=1 Tax=Arctia plantaginis TaxID=874455 RepID=A0A8S0YV27_ARCPL|nr:unnamed protein product [Arctia plantaginis]CAB3247711.1 unnamed protein product [Arctia plantaginis]